MIEPRTAQSEADPGDRDIDERKRHLSEALAVVELVGSDAASDLAIQIYDAHDSISAISLVAYLEYMAARSEDGRLPTSDFAMTAKLEPTEMNLDKLVEAFASQARSDLGTT